MTDKKKFAVIIATYRRKNNTSYNNLLNVHKFLINQTYQNFKVFLIGDDYSDQDEFNKIVSLYPEDKIFSYNNNVSYRTGIFKDPMNLWRNGGALARAIGIKRAIEEGYNYYLHLDDDDIWLHNHIEVINNTINSFPEVDFMVNKSQYEDRFLPATQQEEELYNAKWLRTQWVQGEKGVGPHIEIYLPEISEEEALNYIASQPDLIDSYGINTKAATKHYREFGYEEGRAIDIFNPDSYLSMNSDLQALFGSDTKAATVHYIKFGYAENRTYSTCRKCLPLELFKSGEGKLFATENKVRFFKNIPHGKKWWYHKPLSDLTIKKPEGWMEEEEILMLEAIANKSRLEYDKKIYYNNFTVKSENSVHSSWTVNLKTLKNLFIQIYSDRAKKIEQLKNKEFEEYEFDPLDANLLDNIRILQEKKKIKCIYIPHCTVIKKTDRNIPE